MTANHNMTSTIHRIISTCKLVGDVVPRVLRVHLTGRDTVAVQIVLQVPAFSFIKGVEEKGELLDVWLRVQTRLEGTGFTDNQRADQT